MGQARNWTKRCGELGKSFGARLSPGLRKRWSLTSACTLLVVLATVGAALLAGSHGGSRTAAAGLPYPHDLAQVSFAVAGDVIPHEPVRAAAAAAGEGAQGWGALFSDVSDVFKSVDFGFVNLETPVAPTHSHGSKPFMFDAPIALIDALKASGIKIVSSANNHVMDQGWAGFAETREHLRERGMLFIGSGDTAQQSWQPVVVEANGIKVGWLGMTRWLNGGRNPDKDELPHVNFFPYPVNPAARRERMKRACWKPSERRAHNAIFWWFPFTGASSTRPRQSRKMWRRRTRCWRPEPRSSWAIIRMFLQPVETYRTQDGRNTVIFYSLGNFLSNQSRSYVDGLMPDKDGDPRDEMIGLFSAVRKDYGPAGVRVELGHVGVLPVWSENNRNELASGHAKDAGHSPRSDRPRDSAPAGAPGRVK